MFKINRMKYFLLPILLGITLIHKSSAVETCSRVAVINYQEVLVDAGSNKKGEGLRFYLEKDPVSNKLLNEYQEKNRPSIWSAGTSTVGSLMVLAGLMQTNETSGISNRNTFLYGGGILIAISYLTSKTLQYNNESILKQAVDQYNKRNRPKIFFSPYGDESSTGFGVGMSQEF